MPLPTIPTDYSLNPITTYVKDVADWNLSQKTFSSLLDVGITPVADRAIYFDSGLNKWAQAQEIQVGSATRNINLNTSAQIQIAGVNNVVLASTAGEAFVEGKINASVNAITGNALLQSSVGNTRVQGATVNVTSDVGSVVVTGNTDVEVKPTGTFKVNVNNTSDIFNATATTCFTNDPNYNANIGQTSFVTKGWVETKVTPINVAWLFLNGISITPVLNVNQFYPLDGQMQCFQSGQWAHQGNGVILYNGASTSFTISMSVSGFGNVQDTPFEIWLVVGGVYRLRILNYSKNSISLAESQSANFGNFGIYTGQTLEVQVRFTLDNSPQPNPTQYKLESFSLTLNEIK